MTQSKELKQVMDALKYCKDWYQGGDCVDEAIATLDRLSAPVGVEKIEGLEEAVERRRKAQSPDPMENHRAYPDFGSKAFLIGQDEKTVDKAARAYLELQNAGHIADVGKMVVPDGYKLVPIEPTTYMCIEGCQAVWGGQVSIMDAEDMAIEYKAMLSAAPTPDPTEKVDVEALKLGKYKTDKYTWAQKDILMGSEEFKIGWDACIDHLAAKYDFVRKV